MYSIVGERDIKRIVYSTMWQVEKQNERWAPHAGRDWHSPHKSLRLQIAMHELSKPNKTKDSLVHLGKHQQFSYQRRT